MKCYHCGTEIPLGKNYCQSCGASVAQMTQEAMQASGYVDPAVAKKKRIKIFTIIGVLAVLTITIVVYFATKKTTIDLSKYVEFDEEGYDGYGTVSYRFDEERFYRDYKDLKYTKAAKKRIREDWEEFTSAYIAETPAIHELKDTYIRCSLDKSSELSNGDTVKLSFGIDEEKAEKILKEFKVKIKAEDVTYVVSGLQDVASFDPFDGVEVTFSGVSPRGSADYEIKNNDENKEFLRYQFAGDVYEVLKEGDKVTLYISANGYGMGEKDEINEACAKKLGAVPTAYEKTFTVEGLSKYAESVNDISEETMNAMDKKARDVLNEIVANDWEESLYNMQLIGNYFIRKKTDVCDDENGIYLIYKLTSGYTVEPEGEGKKEKKGKLSYYYYTYFKNVIVNADGSCDVNLDDFSKPEHGGWFTSGIDFQFGKYWYVGFQTLQEMKDHCVTRNQENYNCEENIKDVETGFEIDKINLASDTDAESVEEENKED